MSEKRRIYLDHAATSWPKSPAVMEAMQSYLSNCGGGGWTRRLSSRHDVRCHRGNGASSDRYHDSSLRVKQRVTAQQRYRSS